MKGCYTCTHVGSDAQSSLETIFRSFIVRIAVEEHTEPDLHVGINNRTSILSLAFCARLRSRLRCREEKIDHSIRSVPRRAHVADSGYRRERDGRVRQRNPLLEGGEGAKFLSFVDVGDGE